LGRTVDELLNGSPSHNPISAIELAEWEALEQVRVWEMEKQQKQISYADGFSEGYKRATELAKWGITKKIKG
jgi:flagellar biosynthesis/type III secretory pathway protein FliH